MNDEEKRLLKFVDKGITRGDWGSRNLEGRGVARLKNDMTGAGAGHPAVLQAQSDMVRTPRKRLKTVG
jgi:hypothetical protein